MQAGKDPYTHMQTPHTKPTNCRHIPTYLPVRLSHHNNPRRIDSSHLLISNLRNPPCAVAPEFIDISSYSIGPQSAHLHP